MSYIKKIVAFRISRFVIVGMANTAVNIAVLNLAFYSFHRGKLVSSFIATGCAVVFSFIMNRSFVFQDKSKPAQKLALFTLLTLSGVLLIQNSVYALGVTLLHNHDSGIINIIHGLTGLGLSSDFVEVNLSNVIASLCVMVWNYNSYRLFVFNGIRYGDAVIETKTT